MKIISNKEYQKLKTNKKLNDFLSRGYRANSLSLSFEKAIIEIMKQFKIEEIELPKSYLMNDEYIEVIENKQNNSFIIRRLKPEKLKDRWNK